MRSILVRAAIFCWLFALGSGLAWAQEGPAPAEQVPAATEPSAVAQIWKTLESSKLKYHIGLPRPVAHPVQEMTCSPRVTGMRVVRSSGGYGLVPWEPSEKAKPHFEAAEKFFSENRLSEAAEEYRKGLALDPDYGPGWLYSGDVPFGRKDYAAALTAYRKALALDPTLPQAHRFAADALLKMGRLDDAETEYVRALVYDPSYEGAWSGLELLGRLMGFTVRRPEFSPPADMLGERKGDEIPIALGEADQEWLGYVLCKAVWRNEPEYRRGKIGGEKDQEYSWSTAEERECLMAYLESNLNLTEARLEKEAAQKGQPKVKLSDEQLIAAAPEGVRSAIEVGKAGLLDGFIVVAVLGKRCPLAASLLPENIREDAEQYIRRFVIVRPSARKGS
jgi:tetratricopeptide (TPR) repeat protein